MGRRREGRDLPEIVTQLFERAQAQFPDPQAVNRTLLELSKLYDAASGGFIVEHDLRRDIVDHLRQGRAEEARQALQERFDRYRTSFRPDGGPLTPQP
jgi:hypothetical protein